MGGITDDHVSPGVNLRVLEAGATGVPRTMAMQVTKTHGHSIKRSAPAAERFLSVTGMSRHLKAAAWGCPAPFRL